MGELLARCDFASAPGAVICAFSGGADSTALVALAVAAGLDVTAVHVDHGARPASHAEARRAATTARLLGVAFRCERAELVDGANFEARARAARRRLLGPTALTGHTADDQAETVVLALLRGSGATGLGAMRPGPLHPLLRLRRSETHEVCRALGLDPVDDPTNRDPMFRRNRIRHELLPLADSISDRDTVPLLTRTADLLRDDDELLSELAAQIDPTDAPALAGAPLPLARRAVRGWLTRDGHPPDAAAVERVLMVASGERIACEVAHVGRIARSHQRLAVEATPTIGSSDVHFPSTGPTG